MNRTVIYIGDDIADLAPGTVVATTLKALEIGDIKKRFISHTNRIKLPYTPTNNTIFQHANNVKSRTRKPYTVTPVKLIQNGVEIFRNPVGILKKCDGGYHLEVYESALIFFDIVKDRYVDELDLEVYGPFDETFLDTYKDNATPNGCPVIDYGRMFPPDQVITNQEFSSWIFDPWENADADSLYYSPGGVDWGGVTGGYLGLTLLTANPDNVSNYLHGPYKFYAGLVYRVVVKIEVLSGATNGTLQLEVHKSSSAVAESQTIGTQAINTVGVHYFDDTFTADDDYDLIGIIASQLVAGTNKSIRLMRIDVIPQKVINVKAPYYLPTLDYASTLQKIITNAGYTGAGLWPNLLAFYNIIFSKTELKYNKRFTDKYNFRAFAPGTQTMSIDSLIPEYIEFSVIDFNGSENWYNEIDTFQAPVIDYDLRVKVFVTVTVDVTISGSDTVRVALYDGVLGHQDEAGLAIGQTMSTTGQYTLVFETQLTTVGSVLTSFQVGVIRSAGSGTNTVSVLSGTFYSFVDNTPIDRVHGSNLILPDMSQSDFFTDFLYRVGGFVKEVNGLLTVTTIDEIISDKANAVDWTNKRDSLFKESINFLDNNYAQANYFSDNPDTDEDAKGSFSIDNQNAVLQRTVFNSQFKSVLQTEIGGIKVCRVPIFDFESNDPLKVSGNFDAGVRLVYLRDDETTDPEVKYSDVVETQYKVAAYGDPASTKKATWQYFIDTHYPKLKLSLDSAKIVTRYYRLSELDIAGMDLLKLVYDDGAHYIINSVDNFIPGKSTKVELFKVEG